MARKLAILFLMCISCLCMSAHDLVFSPLSDKDGTETPYIIDIKESDVVGEYIVNFTLGKVSIVPNTKQSGKELVLINGLWQNSAAGEPAVPMKNFSLAIQKDNKCTIEILSADYEEFACNLSVAEPPQVDSHEGKMEIMAMKAYNGYNLSSPLDYFDIQKYRGQYIHNFKLTPVSYNYQTNTAKVCKSFTAKIKTDGIVSKLSAKNEVFDNYTKLQGFPIEILPVDSLEHTMLTAPFDEDLAIITTIDISEGIQDFIKWKQTLGYNVHVFEGNSWTSDEIMLCCESAYKDLENLTNVLIIGDHENIPGKSVSFYEIDDYLNYGEFFVSDIPYSCMDGEGDYMPDFFIARIPNSDVESVSAILNKIISYEKNGFSDIAAYNKHVSCSFFEEDPVGSGMEKYRFVRTSEEIASYGESIGYDYNRIFMSTYWIEPKKWSNDPAYGYGEDIPNYLLRPSFAWNGNNDDIINAFNNGISTFYFNYHGSTTFWGGFGFNGNNVKQFTNKSSHPLVFSICCLTGNYQYNTCLAKNLIDGDSGALGVYASSPLSYTQLNDILSSGIYDALWNPHEFKPSIGSYGRASVNFKSKQLRVTDIIQHSYNYLKNLRSDRFFYYTMFAYHYFGDPTMIFHSSAPKKNIYIPYETNSTWNSFNIKFETDKPRIISIKEVNTGRVKRFLGNNATLDKPGDTLVQVCISGKDILPIIYEFKVRKYKELHLSSEFTKIKSVKYDKTTRKIDISFSEIVTNYDITLNVTPLSTLGSSIQNNKIMYYGDHAVIDVSSEDNGIYSISLLTSGEIKDSINIIVN